MGWKFLGDVGSPVIARALYYELLVIAIVFPWHQHWGVVWECNSIMEYTVAKNKIMTTR